MEPQDCWEISITGGQKSSWKSTTIRAGLKFSLPSEMPLAAIASQSILAGHLQIVEAVFGSAVLRLKSTS